MTTKTEDPAVLEHRLWLDAYFEMSYLAHDGPVDGPLSDDQKFAYGALPDLLDQCCNAWLQIPEDIRPLHYLLPS